MFETAYAIASKFCAPIVLSRRTIAGNCTASIGAYVIVNDQGWIVTAHHIVEQWMKLSEDEAACKKHEAEVARIRGDTSLDRKTQRRELSKLGHISKSATARASAWWGVDGLKIKDWRFCSIPAVDVSIAQLENFIPPDGQIYPKFKDPKKGFEPGRSLCKLGFPFHQITPVWNDTNQMFSFQVPIPRFPIEGILTRMVSIRPSDGSEPPYPFTWIETSSPGLRGQSGGPIFDANGTIWGIQVQTAHLPLGFSKKGEPEQYLNVGLGVHTMTLIELFKEQGVQFSMSDY